jgi:hypothetical protein
MYELANEKINEGLSLGARIALGLISGLFGIVMLVIAPPTDKRIYFYLFGAFCLSIAIACVTTGRVRQFVGSVIGSAIFIAGLAYLVAEIYAGIFISGRFSQPSALNALIYLGVIGVPGASYAYKARFGFRRSDPHH